MEAQEKGHNISFDCSSDTVNVWYHSSVETGQKILHSFYVYRNQDNAAVQFSEAEAYLKGLIA
jgi:hypothetical protein